MQEQVALKDIVGNRYRGLNNYPIQPRRKNALVESVRTTGLWPRLMGRRRKDGKIELCYGHHLLAALLELFGPNHKILIEVRDLPDSQMFMMMARENQQDWDSNPVQDLITVQELFAAIERGEIKLAQAKIKSPNSRLCRISTNSEIVSSFLGWMQPGGQTNKRLGWILDVLDLMEADLLKQTDLEDLSESQVVELIREVSRQRKFAEQRALEAEQWADQAEQDEASATSEADKKEFRRTQKIAQETASIQREYAKNATRTILTDIGDKLRKGEIGAKEVRAATFETIPPPFSKPKNVPAINEFAHELASELRRIFGPNDKLREKLLEVTNHQEHLNAYSRETLVGELQFLIKRVEHWISRLDPKNNNGQTRTPVKSAGPRQLKK